MSKELFIEQRERELIEHSRSQEIEFYNRQIELKHGTIPHQPTAQATISGN